MSKKKTPQRHVGLRTYRLASNPEEAKFAEAWRENNENGKYLAHMLDERETQTGYPPDASTRDETVAATVVQWLGTPVGQSFLRDLGYEKVAPAPKPKKAAEKPAKSQRLFHQLSDLVRRLGVELKT